MKKTKWLLFSISLCFAALICLYPFFFQKAPLKNIPHAKQKLGSYFFPFQMSGFNHQGIPCLSVKIEDQTVPVALDLGDSGDITLSEEILSQLTKKTYLRVGKTHGFRGHTYEKKIYDVPKIQIGQISFWHPLLREESKAFQKDAIISSHKSRDPIEKGRLGWNLFCTTNLFLDLGNHTIAICDSLETLAQYGYEIVSFIKTPLLLNHHILEIQVKIDQTPIHCYLDTGSSWNLLNFPKLPIQSVEETIWSTKAPTLTTSFEINTIPFEQMHWHLFPIHFPFHIDAILGMEFFKSHLVFLDFSENCAYIAKKPQKQALLANNDHINDLIK